MSQPNRREISLESPSADDWRELAEMASHEMNPKKLIHLVERLCDELDKETAARNQTATSPERRRPRTS
jgi:hypothetical protein